MKPKVLFYVNRHGTTGLNEDDRLRGPVDAPLDSNGHKDAQSLVNFFEPIDLQDIAVSSMTRALQTAMPIAESKDIVPHIEDGLRSWDIGYVAGMKEDKQAEDTIAYYQKNPDKVIPEGESLNAFRKRVHPVFAKAIHNFNKHQKPSLISAHDSVVREAGNLFNGDMESALVKPGGVVAVMHDPTEKRMKAVAVFKPEKKNNHTEADE